MAINKHLWAGFICCLFASLSFYQEEEPEYEGYYLTGFEDKIHELWAKQSSYPEEIQKVVIEITQSRHPEGRRDIFTKSDVKFISTFDSPEVCTGIAGRITGTRSPSYSTYFIIGPGDVRLGTLKIYSKGNEEPLVVTITSRGFFLGNLAGNFDPRLHFHSWYFAKLVNDAALEHGTSLTQLSFNLFSGAGWSVHEQEKYLKLDLKEFYSRPANIWNFLPDEVLAKGNEKKL